MTTGSRIGLYAREHVSVTDSRLFISLVMTFVIRLGVVIVDVTEHLYSAASRAKHEGRSLC